MSIEDEKIVMPGDKLGIIEQYLPGEGTYDDNGDIKSAVLGNVKINQKMKVISVVSDAKVLGNVKINQKMKVISVVSDAKPALLKVGDTVYGQITDIKPQRANVKIECMKDNGRPLALPYMGAIHISQAKKDYLEKLSDAFRIGDIVQAKVVKITGDNVDLGTVDEDCGVLKAMCTRCRDFMHTTQKDNELQCNTCNKKERRKVSKNYVND